MKLEFPQQIFDKKILKITNFMKIGRVEAALIHA